MLRGGWEFQEGTAVGFLLVWCGRSATTLVAAGHILNTLLSKNEFENVQTLLSKNDIRPRRIYQAIAQLPYMTSLIFIKHYHNRAFMAVTHN